jgi:hypothetical protein
MKGIDSWAVAAGLFFVVLGAFLLVVSFVAWPVFFYAVGLLVIGIIILVTLKDQEHVEPIKRFPNKSLTVKSKSHNNNLTVRKSNKKPKGSKRK